MYERLNGDWLRTNYEILVARAGRGHVEDESALEPPPPTPMPLKPSFLHDTRLTERLRARGSDILIKRRLTAFEETLSPALD